MYLKFRIFNEEESNNYNDFVKNGKTNLYHIITGLEKVVRCEPG